MKYLILYLFLTIYTTLSFSSDRYSYNKADSRDQRIGKKIDEVFGVENIRLWFYDRKKLVNSNYMFDDERNDYYQLRISAINKIKSSNMNLKLLEISDSRKIFGKGYEKLIISNDDEIHLKKKNIKYLFLIHDYFCEEDTSAMPDSYKGVAIATSVLVGNPFAFLSSISNDHDYFVSGISLSVYDLSNKTRIIHHQEISPAYSYADDNHQNMINRIFDFLYGELQLDKYKKPKEKKTKEVDQKEKASVNLFENPRNKRRQISN